MADNTKQQLQERCERFAQQEAEQFFDAYDVRYRITSSGDYLSCEVLVAGGGPTIILHTNTSEIVGTWGGDTVRIIVPYEVSQAVDGYFRQAFEDEY